MPNSESAKKRLRQDAVRKARNRVVKSQIKSRVRAVREAVAAGDLAKANESFKDASKIIDRAGAKRVIHPNTAARKKSRLQALIKSSK
jgi:small subunit ribosomal protein S20